MSLDQLFSSKVASFSYIQTFYADPAAVGNSLEMSLTSIGLFVKTKPPIVGNVSGMSKPGIVLCICDVREDKPVLTRVHKWSFARLAYDQINTVTPVNGVLNPSSPNLAKFTFTNTVKVETGKTYGIVIIFEDPAYEIYMNRAGDQIQGTNRVSTGSPSLGSFIPKLYRGSNSGVFTPINDTDLAIAVNVARYNSNTAVVEFVNKNYEFFTVGSRERNFIVGERVYQQTANATGTVQFTAGNNIVTGIGTNFVNTVTANSFIVFEANTQYTQVVKVASVSNTTSLVLADVPRFSSGSAAYKVTPTGTVYTYDQLTNKLNISNSTAANSNFRFGSGNTIIGDISGATANVVSIDNLSVDSFVPKIDISLPAAARFNATHNFAAASGSTFVFDSGAGETTAIGKQNQLNAYDGFLLSRSNEIANTSFPLHSSLRKSGLIVLNLGVNAPASFSYTSPAIDFSELDVYVGKNSISNTHTAVDSNSVIVDTEVSNAGNALARHISIKTSFANNRFAEDIRVFALGYRPLGTEILVYAKIHNSSDPETFDDKLWTPLQLIGNGDKYSSLSNNNDLVEYEYGFMQFPETAVTLSGVATTEASNNQIAITADPSSQLANNNLIKIYNARFPENYEVAVVTSVNSSVITVSTPITNNNVIGSGLKIDRLKYYNTGFNNLQNDNIVRYYNTSMGAFDKYDSMQVKIVLLSDSTYNIPTVEQIQVIGVSA